METVPVEDALWSALGDAPSPAALHRAIIDRSKRYTSERDRLSKPADAAGDLAARAVFFTICDAPKIAVPLDELPRRGVLPAGRRVVDIGAGCGALSLGFASVVVSGGDGAADFTLLDRDDRALAIAKAALARIAPAASIATRSLDVTRTPLPAADFVLVGNVLNELPADARLPLIERALAAIADDGVVIIIEPALRETTRALHELRDAVLARKVAHVFAPCTRAIAPCPMLANERDWCHEARPFAMPPRTAELARVTHLRDDGLKFSYLVLRRHPSPLANAWRVVSSPHSPKGKLELDGCCDAGLVRLRLLRRNRSDANRAFERAARGDVLAIDDADGAEITTSTRVTTS
jgi:ribosomal protein RSM22 (predicted rRNA methylase)